LLKVLLETTYDVGNCYETTALHFQQVSHFLNAETNAVTLTQLLKKLKMLRNATVCTSSADKNFVREGPVNDVVSQLRVSNS